MPRLPRCDVPGQWHHVFNRAIGRRTLFERRSDFRYFLAMLARAVRRDELELHAYSLLGTHYHLLVRSPRGCLGESMQRIQLAYSRRFNRMRRRDGSLVRGRYGSKPVRSHAYRQVLIRYIDHNPVLARLSASPVAYPWGSARHYARSSGPRWLERTWVESEVVRSADREGYRPEDYGLAFHGGNTGQLCELVEARVASRAGRDLLDDVLGASSDEQRRWMLRKAILADGTRPCLPLLARTRLEQLLEIAASESWTVRHGESARDGWLMLRVGLGRDLCGETLRELALRVSKSEALVGRLYRAHRAAITAEQAYAARACAVAAEGLEERVLGRGV